MKTLPELIERLRKESPAAIGKLDDKAVGRLLRTAFAAVARDVAQAQDGVVKVVALGAFRIRTTEGKGEGEAKGKPNRRVAFKAAEPKAGKAGKAGKAAKAQAEAPELD